jgi:hypothetical protein
MARNDRETVIASHAKSFVDWVPTEAGMVIIALPALYFVLQLVY